MAVVTEHLARLGLTINDAKSRLIAVQCTMYLVLRLDSITMHAYLSDDTVAAIQGCLSLFQQGSQVTLRLCQKLLGLMAAAISAIELGLLCMRPLQAWLDAFHLNAKCDRHHRLTVSHACSAALRWWRRTSHLCEELIRGKDVQGQQVGDSVEAEGGEEAGSSTEGVAVWAAAEETGLKEIGEIREEVAQMETEKEKDGDFKIPGKQRTRKRNRGLVAKKRNTEAEEGGIGPGVKEREAEGKDVEERRPTTRWSVLAASSVTEESS
ncbi:UNVERIFIED_CONTAM: hypothetical protein FKN15_069941 [Acipenser sinensis]